MSADGAIQRYLETLAAELRPGRCRRRLLREAQAHLSDAVWAQVQSGVERDVAVLDAIEDFGDPREVAAALDREIHPRRVGLALAASTATAAALVAVLTVANMPTTHGESGTVVHRSAADVEVKRVGSALRLSVGATRALATAQALGRDASACLLANGARLGVAGGIDDSSGRARDACDAALSRNERYLDSSPYRLAMVEAQVVFDAAVRCAQATTPRHESALRRDALPASPKGARGGCYRSDGLPALTT